MVLFANADYNRTRREGSYPQRALTSPEIGLTKADDGLNRAQSGDHVKTRKDSLICEVTIRQHLSVLFIACGALHFPSALSAPNMREEEGRSKK